MLVHALASAKNPLAESTPTSAENTTTTMATIEEQEAAGVQITPPLETGSTQVAAGGAEMLSDAAIIKQHGLMLDSVFTFNLRYLGQFLI